MQIYCVLHLQSMMEIRKYTQMWHTSLVGRCATYLRGVAHLYVS